MIQPLALEVLLIVCVCVYIYNSYKWVLLSAASLFYLHFKINEAYKEKRFCEENSRLCILKEDNFQIADTGDSFLKAAPAPFRESFSLPLIVLKQSSKSDEDHMS